MYVLSNVATGNEFHKEAVMHQLFPQAGNSTQPIIIKFLQSNDSRLRTAAVWTVLNLTFPGSLGAYGRFVKLCSAGILSQIKNMANDPCLDVKVVSNIYIYIYIYLNLDEFLSFFELQAET